MAVVSWAQTTVTLGSGTGATAGLRTDTNATYYGGGVAETSGDFYLYFGATGATPQFFANNAGQRALVDLGDLGATPLSSVIPPPVAAYTTQGVTAVAGHTYAALTRFGDTWDFAVFKVTEVQNNTSVSLDYLTTNLSVPNRVLSVTASATVDNAAGIGSVAIASGQSFTVNLASTFTPALSGDIYGAGALGITKSGTAPSWYLLGNATHTGGTTVGAGVSFHIGNANDPATTGSITGNIVNNGVSVVFNRRDGVTFGGSISGTGQVAKTVTGDLTFTGTNTYSGTTAVSAGRLVTGTTNTLSPSSLHAVSLTGILQIDYNQTIAGLTSGGTVNLANSSVLTIGNSSGPTFSGIIQGDGSLVKSGTGTQILSGDNTFTGTTTVTAGTLQLGNGGTTGSVAGGLAVSGAGSLAISRSDNLSLGISISGTGGLIKSGVGTLTITGANTHSGNTTLAAGTLVAGATDTLSASSTHSVGAGTTLQLDYSQTIKALSSSGTVNMANGTVLTVGAGNGSGLFSGVIQGNGSLVKSGTGALTLGGTNTYTGSTTINAGSLVLGTGGTTGSIPVTSIINNGNLAFNRSGNITWAGDISGTGNVTMSSNGTLTLTGNNTYSGSTAITLGGTVIFAQNQTFLGLVSNSAGSVASINSGVTLTFNNSSGVVNFSGTISGAGGIVKTGSATQTFAGANNTYSGGTVIDGGTLSLNSIGTMGTGPVIVNSTGFLRGDGLVLGDVTINSGGVIAGGRLPLGTLNLGNATLEQGAIFHFGLYDTAGTAGTTTGWSLLSLSGLLDLNGTAGSPMTMRLATVANSASGASGLAPNFNPASPATFLIASAAGGITGFDAAAWTFDTALFQNSFTGTFSLTQSGNDLYLNYSAAAIPEPADYALGAGLLGLSGALWRRARRNPRILLGLLIGACAFSGRAETDKEKALRTVLSDGKAALAKAPARDQVLWHYRLGATALRAGDWDEARTQFDAAVAALNQLAVGVQGAADARAMFGKEAAKLFIGEPYERAMAFFYRGLIYWHDGELDNARACFRSMAIIDSDTVEHQYAADWNLADWLDGAASEKLGGDGTEALQRATVRLGRPLEKGRVLAVIEFGAGPQKYATGAHRQQLRFYAPIKQATEVRLTLDGRSTTFPPVDDLHYQATTRGGRVMDHILGNKAQFKDKAGRFGATAMAAGAATAAISNDRDVQGAAGIVALVGLVSYLASVSANPTADVRMWENLPRYLTIAWLDLRPGRHAGSMEFLRDGQIVSSVPLELEIPDAPASIIFLSDAKF
jgi:autotransporter-associated beta strand protein